MKYSVIAIGDELLIGQVTDTNSPWIARHMTPLGWEPAGVQVIADDEQQIDRAIDQAWQQCDVVLMTGGLGPTKDDITKGVLCRYFGGELVHNPEVERNVERVMTQRHLTVNQTTRTQAMVPSSCRIIQNQVGTAPIMWFERDGKVLVSMPGVPHETKTMMKVAVIPQLTQRFNDGNHIEFHTLIVAGIIESDIAERLDAFERQLPPHMHLAYLPQGGTVKLRLTGIHRDGDLLKEQMERNVALIHQELGNAIIGDGDKPLAAIVGDRLRTLGLTLATAESCTGGNIAHQVTSIAGSSDYFLGSVVSYANQVKTSLLGVKEADIAANGVVSEPVVRQMVQGVCKRIGTTCGIATSGIAGPGGGTPDKPVGTVWMAACRGDRVVAQVLQLPGDRMRVIERATTEALLLLLRLLD